MTMKPWIARALRRTLLLAAMVIGAETLLYRALYANPDFPPTGADRVEVWLRCVEPYEIYDAGMVARAAGWVRALDGSWIRLPDRIAHPSGLSRAVFYRGDRPLGWVMWSDSAAIVPAGDDMAVFRIGPTDAAKLDALLGAMGVR